MRRITITTVVLVLLVAASGCNGVAVVKRGPKAGELNWFGRLVTWSGFDRLGLAKTEELPGAYDAPVVQEYP